MATTSYAELSNYELLDMLKRNQLEINEPLQALADDLGRIADENTRMLSLLEVHAD
jgi:hypothetical protein